MKKLTWFFINPLFCSQILGLWGRDFYLAPQIDTAADDLAAFELDPSYSSVARLGKEKLLFAARDGLRTAKGRVSLVHPDIPIEPVLLPGAMAMLEQAGQYEMVIQLSQQAKNVTARDLRLASNNNRNTLRDYESDVTLATALAHCGMAKKELENGRPAMGSARLEEALYTLREGPSGSANLAAELQANIVAALSDVKCAAIVDYLSNPLELAELAMRRTAVEALGTMLTRRETLENNTSNGNGNSSLPGNAAEYVSGALSLLTAEEICSLADWKRVFAAPQSYPWYQPALLPQIGLAHIVAGFTKRRPELINAAKSMLCTVTIARDGGPSHDTHNNIHHVDVAIHVAVCDVLLGAPVTALELLQEDEHRGAASRNSAGLPPLSASARARSSYSAAAAAASLAFPERDGVMAFIRVGSPEGDADLLPGLCLFVEQWLQRLAFPLVRDTKERPPLASLAAYFEDPRTSTYLEASESAVGAVLLKTGAVISKSAASVAELPSAALRFFTAQQQWLAVVAGSLAILTAVVLGSQKLQRQQRMATSGQAPGGAAAAAASSSPSLLPQQYALKQQQQQKRTSKDASSSPSSSSLSKDAALRVVKQWLDIKAEAMGPRHTTGSLSTILAEPALGAVTMEAREAASSGWFWNIRPLRARIDSIDESALTESGGTGGGGVVVVATVDESADLWATNGKKGDSYKSEYKVEYTMVKSGGVWKIASALVLGK